MDYELPFKPEFGDHPYVTAATTRLIAAGWSAQGRSLYAVLNGEVGSGGSLKVKWDAAKYPPGGVTVEVNGKSAAPGTWHYDAGSETFSVAYQQREPTERIEIQTK